MSLPIIDYLVYLRKEKGMTQQDVADISGIQRSNIARIEKNENAPTYDILLRYARAIGYNIDIVLGGSSEGMMKHVGIGHQNYATFQEDELFYVDKTYLIKQWWESSERVTLVTRPRRFGKSLNLSMLECFFSIRYANRGNLFEKTFIWNADNDKYRTLQGTVPVVFVSFAAVKADDFETASKVIIHEIKEVFQWYKSFLEHSEEFNRLYGKITNENNPDDAVVYLSELCDLLEKVYQQKVIVLIDEYDTPLLEAYTGGYYEQMMVFMKLFFNKMLKTNPHLHRAFLTGITRVSKESLFSDMNNLFVADSFSNKYADCFGFTEEEVMQSLEMQGLAEQKTKVKEWYDGFNFGSKTDIYNPWSISYFLVEKRYEMYWINTGGHKLIADFFRNGSDSLKLDMESVLAGNIIKKKIDRNVSFFNLKDDENNIWGLLVASGYMKVMNNDADVDEAYELLPTNLESRIMFEKMVHDWFGKGSASYNEFINAMLKLDEEAMEYYLNDLLISTMSFFDGEGRSAETHPERFYHGFVLGLMADMKKEYVVTSNRESGLGRYDIMIEPRDARKNAFVLEFKAFNPKKEETMAEAATNALRQIEEKKYSQALIERGFGANQIHKFALVFKGKEAIVLKK